MREGLKTQPELWYEMYHTFSTPSLHLDMLQQSDVQVLDLVPTYLIMTVQLHVRQLAQNRYLLLSFNWTFVLLSVWQANFTRAPLWPEKLLTRSRKLVSVSYTSRQGAWPRSNIHGPVCWMLEVSSHFKSPLAGGFDLWHPRAFFFSSPTSGPSQMHGQMNMCRPDCQENR